jgi:uncharacterized Zn-finger protein
MPTDIDHEHTNEPVCPWCGHVARDSFEMRGDGEEVECGECGRLFTAFAEMVRYWTTYKKETSDAR